MCGRFGLFAPLDVLVEYFALAERPAEELPARYNVAPGQAVAVVREERDAGRRLTSLRWGLVPFWAKDAALGHKLINARLETLTSKPAFREAWARRRCLIPVSGFYEWGDAVAGGRRQPFFVRASGAPVLALAGLWERWRTPTGETLETCAIVTTAANAALAPIHDRMPLLVPHGAEAVWLDVRTTPAAAASLAADAPALEVRPVSLAVNDPRRDDAALIAPLGEST